MNNNFSEDDIEQIRNAQQTNSPSFEQILTQLLLNPARLKTLRKNLSDFNGNIVSIAQSKEVTAINQAGFPEEILSEDAFLLDDGTSLCGITVCQTCGGVIKEENLRRCKCGQTCCLRRGCGKFSRLRNEWYCCKWHKFLGEFGFNLR